MNTGADSGSVLVPSNERRVVSYVGLRAPGAPQAKLFVYLALGSVGLLMTAPVIHDLWIAGLLGLFVTGPVGVAQFLARGTQQAPMMRRFDAYRELSAPAPGEVLRGSIAYDEDDHLGAVLYESTLPLVGDVFFHHADWPAHWSTMVACVGSRGLTLPRTIASDTLHGQASEIALTPDLLEPEHIVPGTPMGSRGIVSMSLVYVVPAVVVVLATGRTFGLMYLLMALGLVASLPPVRRLLRPYRWEHNAPLAGCGVVVVGEQRFTCDDAVMIVQRTLFTRGIVVTLLGRAGKWTCGFSGTTDDDFINLWQRWNHLDPKPELLVCTP